MVKKALVIIGLCILAGYLIFAAIYFEEKPKEQICSHFEIVSDDSNDSNLVDIADIEKLVDSKGLNPYGKPIKEINTYEIEQAIVTNNMIKSVKVFVTGNRGIRVVIKNKKPVLRIIPGSGTSYYIDKDGEKVPLSKNYVANLPLATGAIKEEFAKTELREFALFLQKDEFWDSQIEQIVVLPNNDLKLIPAVGDQVIVLGKLNNYKEKLDKLKVFYKKALPETGWNRYSVINLKYDKQVIGTKR
ncbi:cell division protein FtsQ/DivIB [Viscerimonas tarda]